MCIPDPTEYRISTLPLLIYRHLIEYNDPSIPRKKFEEGRKKAVCRLTVGTSSVTLIN